MENISVEDTAVCPKCHKEYVGHPALSREDNKTEVCPACGTREAMEAFMQEKGAAVDIVNQAIEKYRASLEAIVSADDDDNDPILIEGSTTTGHQCQLFVNPQEVARIILGYDYPSYRVLGQEAPQGMWDALGRHFGLSEVYSFDL